MSLPKTKIGQYNLIFTFQSSSGAADCPTHRTVSTFWTFDPSEKYLCKLICLLLILITIESYVRP